jgi:biopolymer transport protein ExbD
MVEIRTRGSRQVSAEIPTASIADITFLLIVYFMVTATLAATRGLDLRFPPADQALEIDPLESVLVAVRPDGGLVVDGSPLPMAGLLGYLRPRLERNPGRPVIVSPDGAAPYGAMVSVLDELRRGRQALGLERDINVALPTEREMLLYWR